MRSPVNTIRTLWLQFGAPGQSMKAFAKSRPGCEVCQAWLLNKRGVQ